MKLTASIVVLTLPAISFFICGCCNCGKETVKQNEDSKFMTQKINVAPGTIHLLGELAEIDSSGESIALKLTVRKVISYGSAVPPVAPGEDITVKFSGEITDKHKRDIDHKEPGLFILRHLKAKAGTAENQTWELIEYTPLIIKENIK